VAALTPVDFLAAAAPDALLPSRIQMAFTLAYQTKAPAAQRIQEVMTCN